MISIISPAKSMDFSSVEPSIQSSDIRFQKDSLEVLRKLRLLSVSQISKIMSVSEKIAELNYQRFQGFEKLPEKQALFAYIGDVYKNIDAQGFSTKQLQFAQNHLSILSALYGLLRPLDKIKAYRLEMSCKLPGVGDRGMADFWRESVTNQLNKEFQGHESKVLLNLASNEYSASIDKQKLAVPVINVHFREKRGGELKNIALNAKRARGMMSDYIIRNLIDSPDGIKEFEVGDYSFESSLSDDGNFFFVRA